ncbi:MAG: SpoIIE family protein phosphatase [Frankiaceae bacterium]
MLAASGEVGRDLLAVDWDGTPLGAPAGWPQSLRTMVRVLLTSRFSMWMAWGPELTFFCNAAYRRDTLGTKYPWALGKPASSVWAEIWPDIGPRIERVMSTGEATWDEALLLFLERNGYVEETYHTFSYSPLTDDDGRIGGMLCVVSEDTERVIGERRMATLRDLGSDSTSVRTEVEVLAAAARHLAANPRSFPFALLYTFDEDGSASLGCSAGVPDGHPAAPPAIAADEPAPAWPVTELARGEPVVVELADRYPALPTGAWDAPPARALVVPLPQQGQSRPYGFLVAGLNRYRLLDDDYRSFVDLVAGQIAAGIASARAYEAERRRAQQLAELDRAKTAFFTNVSHEFRTPLTLLLGPAEDALADTDPPLAEPHRRRVEVVHRNAERLLKLVNALLDFSRLESGRETARYEPVDLARSTVEIASMFRSAADRAGLSLTVDAPPLPEPVHVDREMWAKVVLNLLSNALKFTFEGGITVRMRAVAHGAELTVSDTGIGIEPAELGRLFERFHRVVGARSRTYEGSGIGLALVAELVQMHGGEVGVRSAPGEGSSFTVRMPFGTAHLPAEQVLAAPSGDPASVARQARGFLAEASRWLDSDDAQALAGAFVDDGPSPGGAVPDGSSPGGAVPDGDRPVVLVVDDNADMRDYVARLLAGSYRVRTAPDGEVALRLATESPPDLVLTDVMMPRLDGLGLLAALRDDPATTAVPVVMLSARAGEEGVAEGLEAGADDYLTKPFSARELRARVRANLELDRARRARDALERSRRLLDQAQRLARVGSWEIDPHSGTVSASDQMLELIGMTRAQLATPDYRGAMQRLIHPDDLPQVEGAIEEAAASGKPVEYEVRLMGAAGERRAHVRGEVGRDRSGRAIVVRGSVQDVTEQRQAEHELATAMADREAAAREHRIADELQRSLLPPPSFHPEHLDVATYYRAGVEGVQVGGDWFDVIELGAGRTALVIGDVMGRGVPAAAVMGQLRAAIRAYARLDLPPADVLELCDGVVRDLGEDQLVTCLYAVYDPADHSLAYANAGHLPPLLVVPGRPTDRLVGAAGSPLGSGPLTLDEERIELLPGTLVALCTDGLIERRDSDLDTGIDALAGALAAALTTAAGATARSLAELPDQLVSLLLPEGPEDDVAVLLARVPEASGLAISVRRAVPAERRAVQQVREYVAATLTAWGVPEGTVGDAVLLVSELVTNAVVYGRPPIELRLRQSSEQIVLEVYDGGMLLPRRLRPTLQDEHGRGLQLVSLLAARWGIRPTPDGKSVWCMFFLAG